MNKLYSIIVLLITALTLMSNSGGRGSIGNEAVTGAPGENGRTCGSNGCHDDGQFSPAVSVELISPASGSAVDAYKAGREYTARVTISASDNPNGYGFQMVAVNDSGISIGEWGSAPNTQTVALGGKDYIEHSNIIADPVIDLLWISPDNDQGNITFHISANAVNGTGSPAGDGAANSNFVFEYDPTTSTKDVSREEKIVYPNPALDQLNVKNHTSNYYFIYNAQGQTVQQGNLSNDQIVIGNLNPGMYILQLDNDTKIDRFIKL